LRPRRCAPLFSEGEGGRAGKQGSVYTYAGHRRAFGGAARSVVASLPEMGFSAFLFSFAQGRSPREGEAPPDELLFRRGRSPGCRKGRRACAFLVCRRSGRHSHADHQQLERSGTTFTLSANGSGSSQCASPRALTSSCWMKSAAMGGVQAAHTIRRNRKPRRRQHAFSSPSPAITPKTIGHVFAARGFDAVLASRSVWKGLV